MFVVDKADNSVIRANLDGSDANDLGNISGFLNNPNAIAVNASAGKLYVVNESGNSVVMSNLDGSNPVNLTFGGLLQVPVGIALDAAGGKIYVSVQLGASAVVRANLDGSGAEGLGNFGGCPRVFKLQAWTSIRHTGRSTSPPIAVPRVRLRGS